MFITSSRLHSWHLVTRWCLQFCIWMDHICIMSEGNENTYIKILSHIQAFGVDLQYYYYYLVINWATKTDVGVTVYRYILCLYLVLPEQTWGFTGTWGQPLLNYPGRMDILGYYWFWLETLSLVVHLLSAHVESTHMELNMVYLG